MLHFHHSGNETKISGLAHCIRYMQARSSTIYVAKMWPASARLTMHELLLIDVMSNLLMIRPPLNLDLHVFLFLLRYPFSECIQVSALFGQT